MIKHETELKKLSKKIRKLRKEKKLTLEKLAYYNDIGKATVSVIENCKKSPSLKTLVKIANGLDCKVKDLFDD
ncbi:MAG: helix-turn-helix transcriptional regulator [Elusimicrobiaceae bacterium]|jgi:transcriptional regulator with XRE-family HTH domain|nr:helix-turn-helix transcriptional regulator [Elusimicrobiaceae bacterium]MBT3955489.1 helix-turn-helix transcriptional regulator [Elusimicrobiaceae bacterium]MBT4008555.1 helix-turn-helix transcriptional regulator [Elusimicrobiaceae bacterium]MBT4402372.1 helix-turn-helix transcriptional regulator [Elusimicrobiaceae bacterium]MBT4440058.1 helix-turn-helix transcriptional regulator [Elusimicrobiaceae bacterium]